MEHALTTTSKYRNEIITNRTYVTLLSPHPSGIVLQLIPSHDGEQGFPVNQLVLAPQEFPPVDKKKSASADHS